MARSWNEREDDDDDGYNALETITRVENYAREGGKKSAERRKETGDRSRACRETLSVTTARSICHREGNVRGVHARGGSFGQVGGNIQRQRAKRFVDIRDPSSLRPGYRSPSEAPFPPIVHPHTWCPRARDPRR